MARRISQFDAAFASEVIRATGIALSGERIRAASAPGSSIRAELSLPKLEALYETAYLRIYLRWEDFLEQTFLRYLCGYSNSVGACTLLGPAFSSLAMAEAAVLGKQNFVNWADPSQVVARSKKFMTAAPHELVINSNLARLTYFKAVRNRIAHSSEYARAQFDNATRALTSRRYPGSSAGIFLRDAGTSGPTLLSWLEMIGSELTNLAGQVCF